MTLPRPAAAVPVRRRAGVETLTATLLQGLASLVSRHRQRRALAALDDRLLADVGLSREDVERQCRKPPWR